MSQSAQLPENTPQNVRAILYLRLVVLVAANLNDSRAPARRREAARLAKLFGRNLAADITNLAELRAWGSGFLPQRTVDRQFLSSEERAAQRRSNRGSDAFRRPQGGQAISVADC